MSNNRSRVNERYVHAKKETVPCKQYVQCKFSTGKKFDRYRVNVAYISNQLTLTTNKTNLLGVVLDDKLKFDAHISGLCRKVSAQINALNRLKNILPVKTKESLYRSFILPYIYYYNQVWHHCGKRNTTKIEKVNERALRCVYKDKQSSYHELLQKVKLPSMESRRIQDMIITINNSLINKALSAISDLITLRSSKYNLRGK